MPDDENDPRGGTLVHQAAGELRPEPGRYSGAGARRRPAFSGHRRAMCPVPRPPVRRRLQAGVLSRAVRLRRPCDDPPGSEVSRGRSEAAGRRRSSSCRSSCRSRRRSGRSCRAATKSRFRRSPRAKNSSSRPIRKTKFPGVPKFSTLKMLSRATAAGGEPALHAQHRQPPVVADDGPRPGASARFASRGQSAVASGIAGPAGERVGRPSVRHAVAAATKSPCRKRISGRAWPRTKQWPKRRRRVTAWPSKSRSRASRCWPAFARRSATASRW